MTTISQRQLRKYSGDVLRRAAAGEVFRLRTGETVVELRRAFGDPLEALRSAGRLSSSSGDDFSDYVVPVTDGVSVDDFLAVDRTDGMDRTDAGGRAGD